MAVALAFGVLFGTGFILLFLPSLLLVWNDARCFLYRIWWGKEKECVPEQLEPAVINARRKRNMLKDV
jgi:hypothetical protein